jgi:hypothetical protein
MCFVELEEVSSSSSFKLASLTPEASPNTKELKKACNENFQHFDTLSSQNPKPYGDTNFIV